MKAIVRIDCERVVGAIDPNLYGNFAEHLGRCIYGGIYQPGSPRSDGRGFRKDVADAARRLRITNLRWPGGNFVSGYHWLDGVGPQADRPDRHDWAWQGIESNQFGTDEYIEYCRFLGAEPYICLNLGTGSVDEAANWLAYCNCDDSTHYSQLRKHHGHPEPYGVKFWGLGNELYGEWQTGHKTAPEYARLAEEIAKVMRWTDPSVKLVACGAQRVDWDWEVLQRTAPHVDFISYHNYFQPVPGEDHVTSLLAAPFQAAEYLDVLASLIAGVRRERKIEHEIAIAADEWNVWYRERKSPLEERYDLTDAVAVGAFLNLLRRRCGTIKLANLAQLVNVIAPIFTTDEGLFLQTTYWPLLAAAQYGGSRLLLSDAETDGFTSSRVLAGSVSYLDALATLAPESGKLFLSLVNLHPKEAIEVEIRLRDAARPSTIVAHVVTGERPEQTNSFQEPNNVCLVSQSVALTGAEMVWEAPPLSSSVLEIPLHP